MPQDNSESIAASIPAGTLRPRSGDAASTAARRLDASRLLDRRGRGDRRRHDRRDRLRAARSHTQSLRRARAPRRRAARPRQSDARLAPARRALAPAAPPRQPRARAMGRRVSNGVRRAAISIVSLAWGLGALARYLRRSGATFGTSLVAPLGLLANPNVLYLQSTPMTEPMLIGVALMALDAVGRFIETADRRDGRRAGWWLDGAGLDSVRRLARRRRACCAIDRPRARARGARTVAAARRSIRRWPIFAFLCLSRASTGSWFVSGGFFVPENPALRQPLTALDQIVTGLRGLAGSIRRRRRRDRRRRRCVAHGSDVGHRGAGCSRSRSSLPVLLPLSAFTAGHPFRIRYMVPLVAACWALAGAGVSRLPNRWQLPSAAVLLALVMIQTPPFDGRNPMAIEAQRERPQQRAREAVTRYLAAEHDGYAHSREHGIARPLHAGDGVDRLEHSRFRARRERRPLGSAVEHPQSHVRWILIEEMAEGGDVLAVASEARREVPRWLSTRSRRRRGGALPAM